MDLPAPILFQPKAAVDKRLKILVFGEAGAGKTRFMLTLPKLAVVDTEGGTDHYDGDYSVWHSQDPDEIREALEWLARERHGFASVAIDTFSVVWDALQRKWSEVFLARLEDRRGHKHEFFELGPREWMTIKSDHKDLVGKLLRLDMNVLCTCRAKPEYEGGGELMRRVGTTYDGEKGLSHAFDIVLELWRTKGVTFARTLKDRTGKLLGETFEVTDGFLERTYPGVLGRESKPLAFAGAEDLARIRALATALGLDVETVERRVLEMGFARLEDLTIDAAQDVIRKLKLAVTKRKEGM